MTLFSPEILSNLRKMEENFEGDKRKGKAKVQETDHDSLPPKRNRNTDVEHYYVKLCGMISPEIRFSSNNFIYYCFTHLILAIDLVISTSRTVITLKP